MEGTPLAAQESAGASSHRLVWHGSIRTSRPRVVVEWKRRTGVMRGSAIPTVLLEAMPPVAKRAEGPSRDCPGRPSCSRPN